MSTSRLAKYGIGALAAAAAIIAAPSASADNTFYPTGDRGDHDVIAFANEMTSVGGTGNRSAALRLAVLNCEYLILGHSENEAINTLIAMGGTLAQAQVAVWGAEWHFCPQYY